MRATYGAFAFAALLLAVLSGIVLVLPYDVQDAYGSVASLLLTNPGAVFFRNLHYWAAQAFLVLTGLHLWDHLRKGTERRVSSAVWLRLTLAIPATAFLLISGFILRGDGEARQAVRILATATGQLPWVGPWVAAAVFGVGERLQVVYLHHAATTTIVVWLIVTEHARAVWPRAAIVLTACVPLALAALWLSPSLHDGLSTVIKGPWYFLGVQEALHWTSGPLLTVAAGGGLLALVLFLPRLSPEWARAAKALLLAAVLTYGVLCAVGFFLRGENWRWAPTWRGDESAGLVIGWILRRPSVAPADVPVPLPSVLGRPEGCPVCHRGVSGLGSSHRPEAVGCASCHGGDPFSLEKSVAHAGVVLVPGNLQVAAQTCGQAACHPAIVSRVERSIMTTFSGVISVNRRVWNEGPASADVPHVKRLGTTAADSHLRQLCASCHLGTVKAELGPIHEDSRGGGCNACHLTYSPEALGALRRYETAKRAGHSDPPTIHPALSLDIGNGHCFGCHSRSGRISTNYEGWHETQLEALPDRAHPSRYRILEDGRVFVRERPDIHQEKGLDCIDCHTAAEIMGDGTEHARKADQVKIACADCHVARVATTVAIAGVDQESRRILVLRGRQPNPNARFLVSRAAGPLLNTVVDANGRPRMWRKRTGEVVDLRPPAPVCEEGAGHARLSCISCHAAWAPRCPACHTAFDANKTGYDLLAEAATHGTWVETSGPFEAAPPTLGIRTLSRAEGTRGDLVDTFIPGMVLTIDRNRIPGRPADPIFRRLYARSFSHTIGRGGRSCRSCHNDPIALGYGRGTLRYDLTPAGGRWRFVPAYPPLAQDGLPTDAWIGFLQPRKEMVSTREDVRPFSVEEQKRILRVGACLTCHADDSPVMRRAVRDFPATLARVSPRCRLPVW